MEIRTEYVLLFTILSVVSAIYFGLRNIKRHEKEQTHNDASATTRIVVNLENIDRGLGEIKHETKEIRADVARFQERLVVVEEHVKTAHWRIDGLEKKEKGGRAYE